MILSVPYVLSWRTSSPVEAGQQSWKAQDGRYNVFFGTVTRSNDESHMEGGYCALNDVI